MPHSSAPRPAVTGGSTATTIRSGAIGGRARAASSIARVQSAPSASFTNSPSSSTRPRLVPPYFAAIAVDEPRREMHPVLRRRRPRHPCPRRLDQRLQEPVARRRRRHHRPRPVPEPQRELQHVPGVLGLRPLADLVAPGGVELRPAQGLGIARREGLRHRAVRPHQPPPARLPFGAPVGRRAGHDSGGAEDHDLPRLVERLSDEGDPGTGPRVARLAPFDLGAHPLGARAGLACPPAAQDDPGRPVSLGRQLVSEAPVLEEPGQGHQGIRTQAVEKAAELIARPPRQQASQGLPRVRRRGRARCPPLRRWL